MRADRLLSILMLLQSKGRMTAHDLADQLEVSERTIYRDLEALGMAGIPVYTERGPGGGCSLLDGYQTKLTGLSEAEVRALFLLKMAGPLSDLGLEKALDDALLKLNATLSPTAREQAEQARQRVHLDASWWYHSDDVSAHLPLIQQALWRDSKLCLTYREDDGCWSRKVVLEPYGLVSKAGIWYLVGVCEGSCHVYRVSHILTTEICDEQFVRPESFDLASFWSAYCASVENAHPGYVVPLRVAPEETARLPQMLGESGYRLVEDEEVEAVATEQVISLRNYRRSRTQQKKGAPPQAIAGSGNSQVAEAASSRNKWIAHGANHKEKKVMGGSRLQQKKRGSSLPEANKKNGLNFRSVSANKKKGFVSQKKGSRLVEKKPVLLAYKKNKIPLLTKPSLALCV